MSTKTTKAATPKPKKKGPLAIAFDRIKVLEEKASKPHQCKVATLEGKPVARQYTGRVTMPSYGIPLPAGVGFHGYVSTRLQDDVIKNKVLPPTEDDVLAILRLKAENKYPGHVDVVLSDISVLPEGWDSAGQEEE